MKAKLTLSLFSIASILLVSCVISVMEYRSMSNYVSTLIADDIRSINIANTLSEMSTDYNLKILSVIGDDTSTHVPEFDDAYFKEHCNLLPATDSVMYAYSAYMLTSLELEDVLQSDFIDTRTWFFERLQPRYRLLQDNIKALSESIYNDLEKNSATFERGFYRSIIPGIVAVGVGLLLVFMLYFFILVLYVKPIDRMLSGMVAYRESDKKYTCIFEGDDQLSELNSSISEIVSENQQLRKRIMALRK